MVPLPGREEEDRRIAEDQAAKDRYWKIPICYDDDDDEESSIPLKDIITSGLPPCDAVIPVLLTEEPVDSLIMEDEHLDTIPGRPNGTNDDESLSDEDVPMENFKIYSNPLFDDEEIISPKIDPHYFNAKSNLIESLFNRDILIDSSPKIDYLLEEFSGELAHIDPIPPGIEKADFDLEEGNLVLIENWIVMISSPLTPGKVLNLEIANTILKSPSPSPIPVEDSDSRDIRFTEELLNNDSFPLPEIESSNIDHFNDPSSPHPPPEPPDVEICFNFEPDTGVVTTKVVKGISEHYVLMPNILPTLPTFDPDLDFTPSHDSLGSGNTILYPGIFIEIQSERLLSRDEFSISFIRDHLSPLFDTMLPFSSENEDKVFNPGILISFLLSHQGEIISKFSKSPMMIFGGDIPHLDVPFLHFYPP
ncbi:hypothetical protein Tco_1273040 [Tanacetum coccineum]